MEKTNKNIYWTIFSSTMKISAVTVGGGYVIVPLLRKKFVDELELLEQGEVLDLIVIAQSSPGAIAINTSLQIGYKLGGVFGAFLALIGTVLPPFVLLSIISYFYASISNNPYVLVFLTGIKAGIAAVILNVAYDMAKRALGSRKTTNLVIMILSIFAVFVLEMNVIFIILLSALFGALRSAYYKQKSEVSS